MTKYIRKLGATLGQKTLENQEQPQERSHKKIMNNPRTEAIRKLGTTLGQACNLYPEIGKAGVSAELVHLCPGVQPRGRNVQTLQPRGQATAAAAAAAVDAAATAAVAAAAVFAWIWYGNDGALSQAQQHQSK